MKTSARAVFAFAMSLALSCAYAQTGPLPPRDVVQLSASATLEVPQDYLTLSMSTTRDGPDAQSVQEELKQALDSALLEARAAARPEAMELRSGRFTMSPRYGRDGRLSGWRGSVELLLQGQDIARISSTAGNIQSLTVSGMVFSLSREQRARVDSQVQAMAIERFKARAAEIAKGFGFGGYSLREVAISSNEQGQSYRPQVMAMESRASSGMPVPVEAGMGIVQVTVSGSVQLK